MRRIPMLKKIPILLLLLALLSVLASCRKNHIPLVSVEMVTIGTEGEEEVKIPKFMTADGSDWRPVNELNDQVLELENLYLGASTDPNHSFVLKSYPASSNPDYLQVTICTSESYDTTREDNLCSLVYDQDRGSIIRNQDALDLAGISGVEVSQAVGKAYPSFRLGEDKLHSTEVQGFYIDEEGKIADFYVKLFIDTQISEEYPEGKYELFYVYHTEDGSVSPLSFH